MNQLGKDHSGMSSMSWDLHAKFLCNILFIFQYRYKSQEAPGKNKRLHESIQMTHIFYYSQIQMLVDRSRHWPWNSLPRNSLPPVKKRFRRAANFSTRAWQGDQQKSWRLRKKIVLLWTVLRVNSEIESINFAHWITKASKITCRF